MNALLTNNRQDSVGADLSASSQPSRILPLTIHTPVLVRLA